MNILQAARESDFAEIEGEIGGDSFEWDGDTYTNAIVSTGNGESSLGVGGITNDNSYVIKIALSRFSGELPKSGQSLSWNGTVFAIDRVPPTRPNQTILTIYITA